MERRLTRALGLLLLALAVSACGKPIFLEAQEADAPPSVLYYAAKADYVRAKTGAAAYAEAPTTPASHVETILAAVEEADARIAEVDATIDAGTVTDSSYRTTAALLRAAALRLDRSIPKEAR